MNPLKGIEKGDWKMPEKLSAIVAEAESYRLTIEPFITRVILRPVEKWYEPIAIGKDVKLVLSNGDCYQTRATGFERSGKLNAGLL
jgi:Zn-dependent alcohol dehydrogenase